MNNTAIALSELGNVQTVVGNGIVVSYDYGQSWSINSTGLYTAVAMSYDGQYQTAVDRYATGDIVRSDNYGVSWSSSVAPTLTAWSAIAMSSDGSLQTAVIYGGGIYTSSDYGVNWILSDSTIRNYSGVAMSADGQLIIATVMSSLTIVRSTDGGNSWTSLNTGNSHNWNGISMSSTGQYITASTTNEGLFTSNNFGLTWTERAPLSVPFPTIGYNSISVSGTGQIQVTVSTSNEVYISYNFGELWTPIPISSSVLTSVAISKDGNRVTVADSNGEVQLSTATVINNVGINVANPIYQLQLSTDLAAKPTSETWIITSDERIKRNIVPADIALCYNNMKQLKLKYFEWDSNVYNSSVTPDRHALGFIAQDVIKVFPKAVIVHPTWTFNNTTLTNFHSLNTDQINKTHIGATQQLITIMEEQKEKITALTEAVAEQARISVTPVGNLGIGITTPTYQLQLSTDAAAKPGTTSWTIASDIRIKKNVVDADIGLCYTNFKRMKLKYFEWRSNIYSDSEINDRRALGFIAQDVKEVFPKAVRIHPVYKIGSSEFTDFHTLNVDQIDKTHIGATQMLIQTVETQTDQITALTDTVAEQSRIIDTLQRQMRTMQMTLTQLQGLVAQIQSP